MSDEQIRNLLNIIRIFKKSIIMQREATYYGEDRVRELYRLMDTVAPVDYIVYKPEEVEERIALGYPFVNKIFKKGKFLYG